MTTISKTQNQINISIPCGNEEPIEKLETIKEGIINAIANIDYKDAPKSQINSAIATLCDLLKNMQLSPEQLEKLSS